MESSSKELPSATPREVDLFAEEALEEVFETIDSLRAQFDQLQVHCEKLAAEKAKVDQVLIDKETECQLTKERLQEDIVNLRKVNLQLLDLQKTSNKVPLDLSTLVLDSEKIYQEKVEAEAKVDALQLKLLEKDKYISSLEWQLVDSEAAIASIQVERDRLALELDCTLGREQEDLQALGAVGDSPSKDPLEHLDYGLVESGYVDDMPVRRVRKQPRRHLSDLTTRGSSRVDDFGAVYLGNASLSDYDVPALAEKECNGLGSLKRASNFSNINNLDEHETFNDKTNKSMERNSGKWESFDEKDGSLPALSNKKVGDVSDADVTRNGSPDMWSFTPDSILNVSTGEELSSVPPSPNDIRRLSKDCTAVGENAKQEENHVDHVTPSEVSAAIKSLSEEKRSSDIQLDSHHKMTSNAVSTQDGIPQGDTNRRSLSSDVNRQDGPTRHQTRRSASDVSSNKRLDEYHKWKVAGCKGDPPAKLKISQC